MSILIQELSLNDLHLDSQNPRLNLDSKSEIESLRGMMEQHGAGIVSLAKDISLHGLDPSSLLIVWPQEAGKFVVLEGNRRVTALKLLRQPDLADGVLTSALVKQLRKASENRKVVAALINCVVVNSREEANLWIERRHSGEMGGIGVASWGAKERARYQDRLGKKDPTLQIYNFVHTFGSISKDHGGSFKYSNLERIIDDRRIRPRLGIEIKRGVVHTALAKIQILPILERIVRKCYSISVTEIENFEQRGAFLDKLLVDLPDLRELQGRELKPLQDAPEMPVFPDEAPVAVQPAPPEPAPASSSAPPEPPPASSAEGSPAPAPSAPSEPAPPPVVQAVSAPVQAEPPPAPSAEGSPAPAQPAPSDHAPPPVVQAPAPVQTAPSASAPAPLAEAAPAPVQPAPPQAAPLADAEPVQTAPAEPAMESSTTVQVGPVERTVGEPRVRVAPDTLGRTTLIPSSCKLRISVPRINRVYLELTQLQVDNFPNACSVLMRVLVELSIDYYLEEHRLFKNDQQKRDKLSEKANRVIDHLKQTHRDLEKPLLAAKATLNSETMLAASITALNQYVHNKMLNPEPRALKQGWEQIEVLLRAIWNRPSAGK